VGNAGRGSWLVLALLYMAALFALSSVPDDESDLSGKILFLRPETQNLLHVPAYTLLAWLWWRALRLRGMESLRAAFLGAAIAALYGVSDEVHQYFVPGRTASVTDALLDALGAALVPLGVWLARSLKKV
jgi:VanZ family protein